MSLHYKTALLFALLPLNAQKLDHVGIVVHDLAAAEKYFHEQLGFTIGLRGRLPDGTMDTSIDLRNNDQYLELITVTDRAKAMVRQSDLVAFSDRQEGPFFVALETTSAARTASRLKSAGFKVDGPTGNSWTLDGVAEQFPEGWLRVRFGTPVFFMEYHDRVWKQLEQKYPQLKDDPQRAQHANGAVGIRAAWIGVRSLDDATRVFERAGLKSGRNVEHMQKKVREMITTSGSILLVEGGESESVIGVTLAVADLSKTIAALHRDLPVYRGVYGRSILVPAVDAKNLWIEFSESGKYNKE